MKLRDLDLGWLAVVAVGMFSHVNNTCLVGFCGDPAVASFQVDLPFILFILSVLTFVADHCWYPTSLKKPHYSILLFLNIVIALTISNLALKFIWLPIQAVLLSCGIWLSNWVFDKTPVEEDPTHTATQSDWPDYFTNFLEQHAVHAVPSPKYVPAMESSPAAQMLRFSPDETDVGRALLQWSDESLPYAISVTLALALLATRFFGCAFWDQIHQAFLSAQSALKRRRGRILLLPGGSLARLRSLAPRYVLSKVDDSEDETPAPAASTLAAMSAEGPDVPAPEVRERRMSPSPTALSCNQPLLVAAAAGAI